MLGRTVFWSSSCINNDRKQSVCRQITFIGWTALSNIVCLNLCEIEELNVRDYKIIRFVLTTFGIFLFVWHIMSGTIVEYLCGNIYSELLFIFRISVFNPQKDNVI